MHRYSKSRTASELLQMSKVLFFGKLSPAIILVAIAFASNFALAQNLTLLGVEWQCLQQYDEKFHVLCVPEQTGVGSVAPEALGGMVKTSLSRGGHMRPLAGTDLRDEFFSTDQKVPLFAPPRDRVMIRDLLQQVLCDQAPRCSVIYRGN